MICVRNCTLLIFTLLTLLRLQGKSQIVQDELARLGESMVTTSEGTRAIALELCREFEDKFLQHITTGEVCCLKSYILIKIRFIFMSVIIGNVISLAPINL